MAKIIPLCSSSKGNSVYIGNKTSGVLIDIGCSFKKLRELLAVNDIPLSAVKTLLITHEHTDHICGLFQFTKHTDIPVFASKGTLNYLINHEKIASETNLYPVNELKRAPCDYEIGAFHTPHDAEESVGYVLIDANGCKISYCTDLGIVTAEVYDNVIGSDIVFLESNYDEKLLKNNNSYPYIIKKRILSDIGHLSNSDSAEFITNLIENGTSRIIIGHLSSENNTPETAFNNAVRTLKTSGFRHETDYFLDVAPIVFEGKAMVI